MAKHNKNSKRNIKKRVKRNAKKIKELTAEDILLNPSLVETPQFKALPTEKQILLMNQVKQLKNMLSGRTNSGTVFTSSGANVDPALLSRVNDANTKATQQANENAQLRMGLDAANKAYKREKELNREIKLKYQQEKDRIDQAARIADLEQQKRLLELQQEDFQTQALQKEIEERKKQAHIDQLNQKLKENVKLDKQYELIAQSTGFPEGKQRILSENYLQSRNNNINNQSIYQNQINSFTENGDEKKAEEAELMLNSLNDDDDKKKLIETPFTNTDDDDDNDIPAPPLDSIEVQAIKAEAKLNSDIQTRKEQIEQAEQLLLQQKENKEAHERLLQQSSYSASDTPIAQLSLENAKKPAFIELEELMKTVDNPNPDYRKKLANMIKNAASSRDVLAVQKKIAMDREILKSAAEDKERIEDQKKLLINIFKDPEQAHDYSFTPNIWLSKILQVRNFEQLDEVSKYMNYAYNFDRNIGNYDDVPDETSIFHWPSTNERIRRKQKWIKIQNSIDEFLRKDFSTRKAKLFYDSKQLPDLNLALQELSPSLDYMWCDMRGYTNRTYPKEEDEE